MDIRRLTFANAAFDVCVDKATLDAMLYGSLWDPKDEIRENVKAYVDEVSSVYHYLCRQVGRVRTDASQRRSLVYSSQAVCGCISRGDNLTLYGR